jgi:hypothetical protein
MQQIPGADRAVERKILAILRILAEAEGPIGARTIAAKLTDQGIELSERAVRYHLQLLDQRGLTRGLGEPGRLVTERGREELRNALISDRVGFVVSRIDALAYQTSFDLETGTGDIIVNVSLTAEKHFKEAAQVMKEACKAGFCMGELVCVARAGERIGDTTVAEGQVAVGTACNVTLNGVLLRHAVPMRSRFGGLLQIQGGQPLRFVELIDYSGTTWDPLEIFIAGKLTSVRRAATTGSGVIGAAFREVPAVCRAKLNDVINKLTARRLIGFISVGRPSQPLFEVPVDLETVGAVVAAGLNPMAAVVESGIPAENKALHCLVPYSRLVSVWDL